MIKINITLIILEIIAFQPALFIIKFLFSSIDKCRFLGLKILSLKTNALNIFLSSWLMSIFNCRFDLFLKNRFLM